MIRYLKCIFPKPVIHFRNLHLESIELDEPGLFTWINHYQQTRFLLMQEVDYYLLRTIYVAQYLKHRFYKLVQKH